jgi:hydrogenase maturation factor HypF (carbamoyltransferase family)
MKLKLNKLEKFNGRKGPLLFIIMDGVGIGKRDDSVWKGNIFKTRQRYYY